MIVRLLGCSSPHRIRKNQTLQITIIGGYGYGNTGDEAQLGANLSHWNQVSPNADILVLSPDPVYTTKHHRCVSDYASRVVFYHSSSEPHYGLSDGFFQRRFWLLWPRMVINAHFIRSGFPPPLASTEETKLLMRLYSSDIMHVSGGGFLTGMTKSRLWDSCFIMVLCQYFDTPYFLTGQTIGIFKTRSDRWLAKRGLSKALTISLRDPEQSKLELLQLGISDKTIISSVDDALFCEKSQTDIAHQCLFGSGIDPKMDYITVNYHWWGMDETTKKRTAKRMAQLMDYIATEIGHQILFVPMSPVDEDPEQSVIQEMRNSAHFLDYDYDYRLVRSVIADSSFLVSFKHHPLIFALGEGVPAISVSMDDYYERKNSGAMANFGMDKFCVHGDSFYQLDVEYLLSDIISENKIIRANIISRFKALHDNSRNIFNKITPHIGISD